MLYVLQGFQDRGKEHDTPQAMGHRLCLILHNYHNHNRLKVLTMSESIEKRIAALGRFFQGMQVANDNSGNSLIYVTVAFPDNWIIADEITTKYGVTVLRGEGYDYYFACELAKGFEPIFDAIEYNIKKMRQAQERAELFRSKTTELQALFADESIPLEKLKSLTFSYNQFSPITSPVPTQPPTTDTVPEAKPQPNLLDRYNAYLEKEKIKEEMEEYQDVKTQEEPKPQENDNQVTENQNSSPKQIKRKSNQKCQPD